MSIYNPREVEKKWQAIWRKKQVFKTNINSERPKFYILDMFPYPSGHGLHVGHLKGYIASDVVARFKRMQGYNVLHPMGWDSFGLPTERQAERDSITPREVTERNIRTFKRQMDLVGLSYDWDREFATSDPSYYRWTQWIFNVLFERGLAYEAEVPVNWCPALGTVVANEEVRDGVYIETGDPVERRNMRQWMLKITAYAERLLKDLDELDWPGEVKELQRNWIGRSEGALIQFSVKGSHEGFEVFSTRPETLFGCTFCVLSPEHPLVQNITQPDNWERIKAYVDQAAASSERDRLAHVGEKTGEFTGAYAINPLSGAEVPVWIADYVLMGYGTGAVFGCPGHDQRDHDFARKFALDIIPVVSGGDVREAAYLGDGHMINSAFLDDLDVKTAKSKAIQYLADKGMGRAHVNYNLRDWLFSRQRYWGEPIPVIHGPNGEIEADKNLPVTLPDSLPKEDTVGAAGPLPPLARAKDWGAALLPSTGEPGQRETNVMPQWAGSSWYYLRFVDPKNTQNPWDPDLERYWTPVDLYVGGIEHATLHLLYARFWHKVLYDAGYVTTNEPFRRLFNQGKIQARSFRDNTGRHYYPEDVVERNGEWYTNDGIGPLVTRIEKMSKSRYNVVSPDDVVETYGADCLRLHEMFLGPVEENNLWQTEAMVGTTRFLERVWRLFKGSIEANRAEDTPEIIRSIHQTIRKVTEDIERLRLNTAISQLMIFINDASPYGAISQEPLGCFVRLLAPFAPHISEEMWLRLGNDTLVLDAPWPDFDPELCVEEEITIVVQVRGRLRKRLTMRPGASEDEVRKAALADKRICALVGNPSKARYVFVPNKLLNIVPRG